MELCILFWFYKEADICENRLQLIKKYNPNIKVYGLYGGKEKNAKHFNNKLKKYLDDFYVSPIKDEYYKWINGDLMILRWFKERGQFLKWDSVVVIQWDMLIFDNIYNIFDGIKKNQFFISGLRRINKKIEKRWDWTSKDKHRENYLNFLKYVKTKYNYNKKPLVSLFILEVFPRLFFEKYLTVKKKTLGMLEYRVPIYAEIFGFNFYKKSLGTCWFQNPNKHPLNAISEEINKEYILKNLKLRDGWKIFHPYFRKWKLKSSHSLI